MAAPRDHVTQRGFNFTSAMRSLCADMVVRLPELHHVDLDRVAVSFCQARKNVAHGLQATLTPLKFEHGAATMSLGGEQWACQQVVDATGREYLYILSFYLPRFLDLSVEEKLATTLHELWHISPSCDGDLRRHGGRCYAHGASQRQYDAQAAGLARCWLSLDPPYHLYQFLESNYRQLVAEYGLVYGQHVAAPKLLAV
jgi:predicted metallopeptidase